MRGQGKFTHNSIHQIAQPLTYLSTLNLFWDKDILMCSDIGRIEIDGFSAAWIILLVKYLSQILLKVSNIYLVVVVVVEIAVNEISH